MLPEPEPARHRLDRSGSVAEAGVVKLPSTWLTCYSSTGSYIGELPILGGMWFGSLRNRYAEEHGLLRPSRKAGL
jgi:hypothetical protein